MRTDGRTDIPDTHQRFVLSAALSRDVGEIEAAWRCVSDDEIDPSTRRLLALVHRNQIRHGATTSPLTRREYERVLGYNMRLLAASSDAIASLAAEGIPTLVMKGLALALAHYRDPGVRPMGDVDVLVPPARAAAALEALRVIGWRTSTSDVSDERHAASLTRGRLEHLDLHWYLSYEGRYADADLPFWDAAVPLTLGHTETRALCATDQLAHSVTHGQRWSIAPSFAWIADATVVLRGGSVDPERLAEQSCRMRWTWPLREGLETVRACAGEMEGLDDALAALKRSQVAFSERVEHYYRVREPSGLLGTLPNLWFSYTRGSRAGRGLRLVPFLAFLRRQWRLKTWQVPTAVLGKVARRLAACRGPSIPASRRQLEAGSATGADGAAAHRTK